MSKRLPLSLALGLSLAPAALAQPAGFPSYNDMITQMAATASSYPSICQLVNLTQKYGVRQSWQGRDIYAVKISDNVGQEEDEPAFLMVSAHHGNEYGTPIVALYAIDRLTEGYAFDPAIQSLVNDNEIWIAPVWNVDGYPSSRHNRNPSGTVDLNRNYPFLWNSPCNTGVKGSGPGSEPETQTMVALSEDQRFTKVLDYHSSGRETLYAYRQGCPNHVLLNYQRAEAVALSQASSYGGRVRGPSSNGEHYQWQLGKYQNYAFLTEISNTQSPSRASADQEAARLWPGTVWMLQRPVPVWGHVVDALTGAPIEVDISYVENPFMEGEQNRSEPRFGRYHAFLPLGNHTIRFSHPCYVTQEIPVTVTAASTQLEVAMVPSCAACTERNGSGVNPTGFDCVTLPVLGTTWQTSVQTVAGTQSTHLGLALTSAQVLLPGIGELLLGAVPPPIVLSGLGAHSVSLPNVSSLLGVQLFTQGFRIDNTPAATLVLLNGQDVTLGVQPQ